MASIHAERSIITPPKPFEILPQTNHEQQQEKTVKAAFAGYNFLNFDSKLYSARVDETDFYCCMLMMAAKTSRSCSSFDRVKIFADRPNGKGKKNLTLSKE